MDNYHLTWRGLRRKAYAGSIQTRTWAEYRAAIDEHLGDGWRIEDTSDTFVTLVSGRKSANHVLHLLLTLVTAGLWLPIWWWKARFSGETRKTIYFG